MENQILRLLVVDDNEPNRDRLVRHLEETGNTVLIALDGEEALRILHAETVDLVLLGLGIPKIDGHEVLKHMKAEAGLDHIPVIVVSSVTTPESIVRCIHLGADDYIREPFSDVLLDMRIKVILQKNRAMQAQRQHLQQVERVADLMERVILPMGIALSTETDFGRLLERILLEAKSVCRADAGTLYMRTADNKLRFDIVRTESLGIALGGTSENPVDFPTIPLYTDSGEPNHHNVASHVALTGRSINIPDIYRVEGFDFSGVKYFDKTNNYRSVSSLTVPLKDNEGRIIGVMQLLNALAENGEIIAFDEYNRLIVESLASQAAVVLNNHLLIQRQQKLNKIENDIQIARAIQTNFLPSRMPEVPGWEVNARFHPAREVAGDFYDVFTLPDDQRLAFVIADVCDKGVGAALFMSLTRSLLRAFSMQHFGHRAVGDTTSVDRSRTAGDNIPGGDTLKTAVLNTNNYITEHHLELNMFATLFFGAVDPESGNVVYINGGHCPLMVVSSTGEIKERLEGTGPAVGMFPDAEFGIKETHLAPGDVLLAFTDGITDARNPDGKMFGEAGLIALLNPPAPSAKDLLDRIENALYNYIGDAVQFDDITMLAVRRK